MGAQVSATALQNVVAIAAVAARTSTLTGAGVDLLDYEGLGRLTLHGVRTTGDLAPTIEHSDTSGGTYAAVPAGALSAALTAITAGSDFLQSVTLNVSLVKRWVRLVGTASNTPNHTYGMTFIGTKKYL